MRIGVVTPGSLDDRDAIRAVRLCGAEAVSLWHADDTLHDVDAVILPWRLLLWRLPPLWGDRPVRSVMDRVIDAATGGMPVLGICNGFQILCESHLLPGALIRNDHRLFNCIDVRPSSRTPPPRGPVTSAAGGDHHRLEERRGRLRRRPAPLDMLEAEGRVVFRYAGSNPNGSYNAIAGVSNERGNVVGLMPHPEHCVEEGFGPSTDGRGFFTSVIAALAAGTGLEVRQ